eukprot:TRINITY_DN6210_c0_g1_i10.p1 TRINITY_DN6210_c0_g1~~TRINITY_DN6210_c0_g1_i10.p1  ORF type:complete len:239 (+),score=82.98 TRINITY_DN6210_c0_g1_i10:1256-1972(+)
MKDPYEPRLKPLSEDTSNLLHTSIALGDISKPWTLQTIGDTSYYREEFREGSFTNGIIVLKSLVWPGAYVFYCDNRWFNFYIGYGHKADHKDSYPLAPPLPQPEPLEAAEQPEPNPKDEPTDEMKLKDPALVQSFVERLEEVLNSPERYEEVLNAAFAAVDSEGKGSVERGEIESLVDSFAKEAQITVRVDQQVMEEFFKAFDKEKEEPVAKEELEEPLKAMVAAWIAFLKEKLAESA